MPFLTIKTASKEKINLEEVNKSITKKMGEPVRGLTIFVERFQEDDYLAARDNSAVVLQLNIGVSHGESFCKQLLESSIDALAEITKNDNAAGYINYTTKDNLYIRKKFV